MKKIILFGVFMILALFIAYNYVYKSHRDISSETESFEISVDELKNDFSKSDSLANAKYLDKTIIVSGKISKMDLENKIVTIDAVLNATVLKNNAALKVNETVKIKGRFIGYDDLFEEFKMDECTILE